MPGSGYGRIIGAGKPKDFWGVDQDADAFAQFIQRYLTNFNRWNSPKFLFGESYGTTRSAVLSGVLATRGIALNGIVLLSSFLNPIGRLQRRRADRRRRLGVRALSADRSGDRVVPSRHSGRAGTQPACSTRRSASRSENISTDLRRARRLAPDRFNDIVAKLHRYTGLSEHYIRNSNLRIPYDRFENELAASARHHRRPARRPLIKPTSSTGPKSRPIGTPPTRLSTAAFVCDRQPVHAPGAQSTIRRCSTVSKSTT